MTLHVDLNGMGRLQEALSRASTDAGLVERHIRVNADMKPTGEGMIQTLLGLHEKAYPWGQQVARQISTQSGQVAAEIDHAAKMYDHTDRTAAAELDGSYPKVQLPDIMAKRPGVPPTFVGPVPIEVPAASKFPDVVSPEQALNTHSAFNTPNFEAKFNWLTDTLSPSAIVRSIVQALFHKDIFEFFLKDISGDWDALYRCGTRFYQAGSAVRAISNNLLSHATHLPTTWRGNAADGCELYLLQLDTAVNSHAATYDHFGQAYHQAADGAWAQFELAGSFLADALDACVAIGAAITVGAVTSETIIGAIAGSAAAGWYAWKAWHAYKACTEIMDATQKMLDRIKNSVETVQIGGKQLLSSPPNVLPFPSSPYHHPGV